MRMHRPCGRSAQVARALVLILVPILSSNARALQTTHILQGTGPKILGVSGLSTRPLLWWTPVDSAARYELEVAFDPEFTAIAWSDTAVPDTAGQVGPLAPDTGYYCRAGASIEGGSPLWSDAVKFYVVDAESIYTPPFEVGWYLISLPLHVTEGAMKFLFPRGTTFRYDGSYNLGVPEPGEGFWMKFSQRVAITGVPILSDTIAVTSPGWIILGSVRVTIPISSIIWPDPWFHSPLIGYGGSGYVFSNSIMPFRGYWVKLADTGRIILAPPGPVQRAVSSSADPLALLSRLTISDAGGGSQILYFGTDQTTEIAEAAYELPPRPPEGMFDARFGNNSLVALLDLGRAREMPVNISSSSYPVSLKWSTVPGSADVLLRVGDRDVRIAGERGITITKPGKRVVLAEKGPSRLPAQFFLSQNFPNPFNPTTSIRFSLPRQEFASLQVYDLLGRKIATLISGVLSPGAHSAVWNGTDFPSGIYVYRLTTASGRVLTMKMVLTK